MNDNQEGRQWIGQMKAKLNEYNIVVRKVFQKIKRKMIRCMIEIREHEVLTLREEHKDKVKYYKAQVICMLKKVYIFLKRYALQGIRYFRRCLSFIYKRIILVCVNALQTLLNRRKELASQKEYVSKIRICFISDADKEETYLHEKSLQGLHFVKKEGIRYVFKRGKQASYYYHVSYQEHEYIDEQSHVQVFTENGWEHIYQEKAGLHGEWHYFRIQTIYKPTIDFDVNSSVALYTRLLASIKTLMIMIAVCFVFTIYLLYILMTHESSIQLYAITICWIVFICLFFSLFIYGYLYYKTNLKLQYISDM